MMDLRPAGITSGPLFRSVDAHAAIGDGAMSEEVVWRGLRCVRDIAWIKDFGRHAQHLRDAVLVIDGWGRRS
jgi:hypothetical protein